MDDLLKSWFVSFQFVSASILKVKVFYCVKFCMKKAKENPSELARFRGGSPARLRLLLALKKSCVRYCELSASAMYCELRASCLKYWVHCGKTVFVPFV